MIVIRVQLAVQPEQRTAFIEQMQGEMASVPAGFSGCQQYVLYADVVDENKFMLYEEWDSLEAFDAYRHSEAFKANGQVLFPMLAGKPDSAYYAAEAVQ